MSSHDWVLITAIAVIGGMAALYVLHGGDGAALAVGVSAITTVLGFKMGQQSSPTN